MDFTTIYQMFYKRVYTIAFKISRDVHLTEDIIQETFIKAYKKLDSVLDPNKMGPWLSSIASHTAIDFMRKGKRANETLTDYNAYNQTENNWCVTCYQKKETERFSEQEIIAEVRNLKPQERHIFIMKYDEGMKEEEIACKLHISRAAVKSRLYRARQNLKTELMKN
nr:RNA polymerase sigma factor [Fictibacillus nanhaiensis]